LRDEHGKRDPEAVKAAAQRVLDEVLALREQKAPASLPRLEKQGADYVVLQPDGTVITRSTDQTVAEQALVSARRETVQREMRDVHTGINEAVEFIQKVNEARQRGEDIAKVIRESAPRTLLTDYEANPTQENLDRLFETVRAFGQEINEPAELASFPVTGSNQGALAEGIWRSIIRINEGADGTIVMREFAQDNLKRAISEGRVTMDFVRQQLNDILPQIDSSRIKRQLRTETDTDVIEAFSDVALAYFRGSIREEQIPAGLRGIMRRLAIISRDIFRRAYNLARLRAEGKLDRDFEALLAEAVGVNQQALVDRSRERTEQELGAAENYSIGLREPSATSFNETTLPDGSVRFIAYHGSEQALSQLDDRPIYVSSLADGAGYGDATRMVIEGRFLPDDQIEAFAAKYGIAMEDLFHDEASMEQDLQEALRSEGYDGAIYYDQRRDDGDVMPAAVIVNPNAIQVAPVSNYSIGISPTMDTDYLAAVERGDMEMAQRMVDAKMAKLIKDEGMVDLSPLYHGGPDGITVFSQSIGGRARRGSGIYLATTDMRNGEVLYSNEFARKYDNGKNYKLYALMKNPVITNERVTGNTGEWTQKQRDAGHDGVLSYEYFPTGKDVPASVVLAEVERRGGNSSDVPTVIENVRKLLPTGYDNVVSVFGKEIADSVFQRRLDQVVVFDPNQIKSADPVTRDADGNVIPLSQRFDATTADINYSIVRSVDYLKNDTRFDKLVKDGRVFTGVDVNDFIDQHILLHSPDNAFAGTIQLTDGEQIDGKGGVYYPALYADKNYFWASTEAMVMRTANHLNEIGAKNGGRVLMGLVSAPVEKLFSSTSMSAGVVKFLNALTTDTKAGLSKDDLNAMIIAASKVEVVKKTKGKPPVVKTFKTTLKDGATYAKTIAKIDALLDPDNSVFQVRKAFVESLANQVSKHLNANKANAKYVAGILADAENKHAKNSIKRGTLSKASFLQGLGNMLTEPFLRDFQEHGNGKIYAIVEVQGEVKGIATTEHESYPATIVPVNKKSKVKLHVLKEAVDWQRVVGKDTGKYTTKKERLKLLPTSGMSATSLKVLGVKAGSSAAPLNYSIGTQRDIINDAIVRLGRESATMTSNTAWMTPSAKFLNVGAHGHADILGDTFQISVVDYMNLGFVRLNARESGKLYADGFSLSPKQVAELKSTAIEKQLELVIERGTQDQQNYSIGVPTNKQRLDLTRYSEEDAINIIMFLDALAMRQTNQGINEQWFIRAYRALPQTFKDAIAYDGEDTLFRGTDPDFNYQEDAAKGYISQMTMTFTSQESYAKWFGSNVISTDPAVLEAAGVPAFTDSIDTGKVREMYNRRANKNMLFDHIGHDIEVGDDEGEVIMLIDDGRTLDDAEAMSFYDEDLQDLRERHEREGIIEKIRKSNYSISTQSEIDRVQKAMDRLARSPSERISQYAALKERLAAALERNQPIMQSMRGDTLPQDFDRSRIP
jgi:hypothetical protein